MTITDFVNLIKSVFDMLSSNKLMGLPIVVWLVLASMFGLIFCFLAFIMILFVVVRTLVFGDPVAGWPSILLIMVFLIGCFVCSCGEEGITGEPLVEDEEDARLFRICCGKSGP